MPVEIATVATDVFAAATRPHPGAPAAELQKVLDQLASMSGKPIDSFSPSAAGPR